MFIKLNRRRHAKQRPTYYKTECLDCELIISVKWEQAYVGAFPTRHTKPKDICPFCGEKRIKTFNIREQEYLKIIQHWDMMTVAEMDDDQSILSLL